MPCLLKRKSGIYYVVTTENGMRVWRSLRTRDASEAHGVYSEIDQERRLKAIMSITTYAGDFTKRASLSLSPKTIQIYKQSLGNLARIVGDRPIRRLSPLLAETFKEKRVGEVSPVTVNIELRTLKAAFAEAQRLKLLEESPFRNIHLVRVPFKEAVYLTEQEFTTLLDSVREVWFRDLLRFAVFTMMRLGEIVQLRWADVDLERKQIHIRNNEGFRVKGGKPRTIPMNEWVHRFLSNKAREAVHVFCKTGGYPLLGNSVSGKFKNAVVAAGLSKSLHFHSLRHTGISWLINRGVPPPFVQRIAGHSSLSVTRIYTHLEDGSLQKAVNSFGTISSN